MSPALVTVSTVTVSVRNHCSFPPKRKLQSCFVSSLQHVSQLQISNPVDGATQVRERQSQPMDGASAGTFYSCDKTFTSSVILKTASAIIASNHKSRNTVSMNAGILMDCGAMRSFISTQLCRELQPEVIGNQLINLSVFGST